MTDPRQLIEQFFDSFNRRSQEGMRALCDEGVELIAVTGELAGRSEPYRGHEGLADYLADVHSLWEELLISVGEVDARGELVVVVGRVYARSRQRGMRDLPAVWVWRLCGGRFAAGRLLADSAPRVPAPAGQAEAGDPQAC